MRWVKNTSHFWGGRDNPSETLPLEYSALFLKLDQRVPFSLVPNWKIMTLIYQPDDMQHNGISNQTYYR